MGCAPGIYQVVKRIFAPVLNKHKHGTKRRPQKVKHSVVHTLDQVCNQRNLYLLCIIWRVCGHFGYFWCLHPALNCQATGRRSTQLARLGASRRSRDTINGVSNSHFYNLSSKVVQHAQGRIGFSYRLGACVRACVRRAMYTLAYMHRACVHRYRCADSRLNTHAAAHTRSRASESA